MLDTSWVQNIWFYPLWCPGQSEFVALRGISLQAPQQVAPTALLQQIQIKRLHTEGKDGKQSIVRANELVYFFFRVNFNLYPEMSSSAPFWVFPGVFQPDVWSVNY